MVKKKHEPAVKKKAPGVKAKKPAILVAAVTKPLKKKK